MLEKWHLTYFFSVRSVTVTVFVGGQPLRNPSMTQAHPQIQWVYILFLLHVQSLWQSFCGSRCCLHCFFLFIRYYFSCRHVSTKCLSRHFWKESERQNWESIYQSKSLVYTFNEDTDSSWHCYQVKCTWWSPSLSARSWRYLSSLRFLILNCALNV